MEAKICQSCGMPIGSDDLFGKNEDGTVNEDYCAYCYENGAFRTNETLEEMIETCVPFMLQCGEFQSEDQARTLLKEVLPKLKRWNPQE